MEVGTSILMQVIFNLVIKSDATKKINCFEMFRHYKNEEKIRLRILEKSYYSRCIYCRMRPYENRIDYKSHLAFLIYALQHLIPLDTILIINLMMNPHLCIYIGEVSFSYENQYGTGYAIEFFKRSNMNASGVYRAIKMPFDRELLQTPPVRNAIRFIDQYRG